MIYFMKMTINNLIEVKEGQFGRGVFATCDIPAGQILEVVPVILVPKGNLFEFAYNGGEPSIWCKIPKKPSDPMTQLSRYAFSWTPDLDALALGYGSIYNHCREHTVDYFQNILGQSITFKTRVNVSQGQELFINYAYNPDSVHIHREIQQKVDRSFNENAERWHKIVQENQERYIQKENKKVV